MAKYSYRVDARRKVAAPWAGYEAYTNDTLRLTIPFGRGHLVQSGAEAAEMASIVAESIKSEATEVTVWHIRGCMGTGAIYHSCDNKYCFGWRNNRYEAN